ncbi:MAG: aminotransferase class V-fold PLP-dependent enzyme [Phycisphaeraceae bacterium]|nr:aminotransferase class V-fold PLP-dependent enzyme [Phycisphaeraceae bacterium]
MPHALSLLPSIRSHFPGLSGETIMLDNAGGSQLPRCVIDAMRTYMEHSFVQLGADYPLSQHASRVIPRARQVVKMFLGGGGDGEVGAGLGDVFFGSSSTVLCYEIASAYADARDAARNPDAAPPDLARHAHDVKAVRDKLGKRDQIVVCTAGHEANIGPWMRLALRGYAIVPWHAEPMRDAEGNVNWRPSLDTLRKLVNEKTLLVLVPQVSNILGEVWDVRGVAEVAHSAGARVLVDGVAYAPHRAPDMAELGCDWYVYSTYKVFGPHMAAMFGTHDALSEVLGPNHYFIDRSIGPYKWELGNANHEGAAGVAALWEYVGVLSEKAGKAEKNTATALPSSGSVGQGPSKWQDWTHPPRRDVFEKAFSVVREIEDALTVQVIEYLLHKPSVRIVGPRVADGSRVGTISFTSERATPRAISLHLGSRNIGIRQGHAYSKRLVEALATDASLNLDPAYGVARVSLQHYNTPEELKKLFSALDEVI